jgi:mono/diheme cytochrome c family protein
MTPLRATLLALACGASALGLSALFGRALQRRIAAPSHQRPPYQAPASLTGIPRAELVAQGRQLFVKSCAHCHGLDARGDDGPDLHALWVSDRRIATVVHDGIKGEMPSFAKKHDSAQIALLVAYVRSLQ